MAFFSEAIREIARAAGDVGQVKKESMKHRDRGEVDCSIGEKWALVARGAARR